MKWMILGGISLSLIGPFAFAKGHKLPTTKEILDQAQLPCGYSSYSIKSGSDDPKKLLIEYLDSIGVDTSENSEFHFVENPKSLPGPDEDAFLYGTTDAEGFGSFFSDGKSGENITKMQESFDLLDKEKTRYQYLFGGSTGGAVCGVSYPGPLLIDLKERTLFEITMVCGPC